MTMGLKVRRVLDEEDEKKAKDRKNKSDTVMEEVYLSIMGSWKGKGKSDKDKDKNKGKDK